MARVFDALTRAGKEKKESAAKSGGEQCVLKEETFGRERLRTGSAADSGSASFPFSTVEFWPKSRRERVEEFLLGWDLKRYKRCRIVALEKDSVAAEQFKIVREQVKRLRSETGVRSLSVTSPVRKDGKTMVAVNLAAALALDYEEQVLLIDGDLRSPEVHRYFGIQSSPGLADYLSSSSNGNLGNYVHETFLPGLRVFPAGKPSDLSSELLAKEKMRSIMDEIRSRFPGHQIIVDTPPVLPTPDPLVLAREVDGIIMVIRADKTPRKYLMHAIQSLNSNKLMGIVLNGVETRLDSKYYNSKKGS